MESNAANGAMLSSRGTEIETFTGQFVDVLNPDPEVIRGQDIAHHLALLCRYGGATKRFYSIAEHSVLVYRLVKWCYEHNDPVGLFEKDRRKFELAAFLHDAAEAYLCDLTAPLKYALRIEEAGIICGLDFTEMTDKAQATSVQSYQGAYNRLSDKMNIAIASWAHLDSGSIFDDPVIKSCDMWALRIEAESLTHTGGENWRWEGRLPNHGKLPEEVDWYGGLCPADAERQFIRTLALATEVPWR